MLFSHPHLNMKHASALPGDRVGRRLRFLRRDRQRGVAVCSRLPCVRYICPFIFDQPYIKANTYLRKSKVCWLTVLCLSCRTFHGNKSLKDFVRRRRWVRYSLTHSNISLGRGWWWWWFFFPHRKCKITLTAPWQEVPPIPLSDITVLPCLAQSSMEQVPVWGLSDKGDVLCRLGVTPQNPAVRNIPQTYNLGL